MGWNMLYTYLLLEVCCNFHVFFDMKSKPTLPLNIKILLIIKMLQTDSCVSVIFKANKWSSFKTIFKIVLIYPRITNI